MASRRTRIPSDSEESEISTVESCKDHPVQRLVIEEILYEMELTEYFRKLRERHRTPRVEMMSKACQTNPDTSTIPPSWILNAEKLASELHTGLGNIINRFYHSTERYGKRQKMQRPDSRNIKYYRHDAGHIESRLQIPVSGIKMPTSALSGTSLDVLKELESLRDKAGKLCITLPYIEDGTDLVQIQEKNVPTKLVEGTEIKSGARCADANYNVTEGAPCCSNMKMPKELPLLEKYLEISDSDSIVSACSSKSTMVPYDTGYEVSTKPPSFRHGDCLAAAATNSDLHPKKILPGIALSKYRLPSEGNQCREMFVPKTAPFSSDRNAGPSGRTEQNSRRPLAQNVRIDNPSSRVTKRTGNGHKNLPQPQNPRTKNFIKRNILATRSSVVRRSAKSGPGL